MKINEVILKEAVLRRGSRGPEVRKLQLDLGVQPADGIFGPATERAVRDFQQRMMPDSTPDGIVGPQTATAIKNHQSIDTGDTSTVEPNIENSRWAALSGFGTSRQGGLANNPRQTDAIKELQALLGIEATGRYDRATANAVRQYQQENDLYPDGDAGPKTISHMINAERQSPITSTPLGGDSGQPPRPMMNPNGGRIQGPLPPDVEQQLRDAQRRNDAITLITLINRYEKIYNAFMKTPGLYDELQQRAEEQRAQQTQR